MNIKIINNKLLHLLHIFKSESINKKIFSAALTVGISTVCVKALAFVKELVVAWKFGLDDNLDAFFIAFVVPSLIINVIAGSFHASFIPTYIQLKETGDDKSAQNLLSGTAFSALIVLIIMSILMITTAPVFLPAIAGGFDANKINITFKLLCAFTPFIILSGIIYIWSAALNARERFILAAISPVATPLITILLVFLWESWGSFSLVIGLIGGAIVEAIILGIGLKHQGVSLFPKWSGFNSDLRKVTNLYLPTAAGTVLVCGNSLIDQSMAALLPAGSVAALNYADKVVGLPFFLIIQALSTAIVPYFSKMAASNDWLGINKSFNKYLRLILVLTIPLTFCLIIFSEHIVTLIFQRGSFTAENTILVSRIQALYALKIPFSMSSILVVRLIISMQKNYILMWGSFFNFSINIVLNYLFIHWIGITGIALSTSFVSAFSFCFLLYNANKFLKMQIST